MIPLSLSVRRPSFTTNANTNTNTNTVRPCPVLCCCFPCQTKWVEHNPSTLWRPFMDVSVYIVQGTEIFDDSDLPAEQPLLFSKGLKGQGQIIGIADTGIDHDSCFFHDAAVPVPLCKTDAGTGSC